MMFNMISPILSDTILHFFTKNSYDLRTIKLPVFYISQLQAMGQLQQNKLQPASSEFTRIIGDVHWEYFNFWHRIEKVNSINNSDGSNYIKMRKISFAVIGGGPAAFYTSRLLLRLGCEPLVDMYQKQLCPFGLIRYGVAPDHISIKRSQLTLSEGVNHPNFRYFGNCPVNSNNLAQIRDKYSGVIYAYGASQDHVPSWLTPSLASNSKGVKLARELVYWYNGHPDQENIRQNLTDVKNVTIVGNGNVAIDIARILMSSTNTLENTQISMPALQQLKQCKIQNIEIIGRRGVTHSAFAVKQIRELHKLGFTLYAIQQELEQSMTQASQIQCSALGDHFSSIVRMNKRKVSFIKDNFKIIKLADIQKEKSGDFRKIIFRYLLNPVQIRGSQLICDKTALVGQAFKQKSVPTGVQTILNQDLLIVSTGFEVSPLDENHYDSTNKKVHNSNGCVVNQAGTVQVGNYATGWCKSGPKGVLDETLLGCEQTLNNIRIHLQNGLIQQKSVPDPPNKFISFQKYLELRQIELSRGNKQKFIKKKLSHRQLQGFYGVSSSG